jgi:hypothetical protein
MVWQMASHQKLHSSRAATRLSINLLECRVDSTPALVSRPILVFMIAIRHFLMFASLLVLLGQTATAQQTTKRRPYPEERSFKKQIQPILQKYCFRCHNTEEMQSGIKVDHLDGAMEDNRLFLWKGILDQVSENVMPPEDEPQLTAAERALFETWIENSMNATLARDTEKNGSIRRLTVEQYKNTLEDLLGIDDNLTDILPPDGISRDGFKNNGDTLLLSPLLVEAYFKIAEQALNIAIVDEATKPSIQNFKMDLGEHINADPYPDPLILGALSRLLPNDAFIVSQLEPNKPFDYEPFYMQTKFRFIEGYRGNDTVRGWRDFDSIYHAVFACVRGTDGYPKGNPYDLVPEGLLLRPAIPSLEIFGQSSTYGPMSNFKISLRELPPHGRFRVSVKAAKYNDALLLPGTTKTLAEGHEKSIVLTGVNESPSRNVEITQDGLYQMDVYYRSPPDKSPFSIKIGDRVFQTHLHKIGDADSNASAAVLATRLDSGNTTISFTFGDLSRISRVIFTPLEHESDTGKAFLAFERRLPILGVHAGLRRDCGSTLARVGEPISIDQELVTYTFEGAINNYPSPDVEDNNVNYLAGVREIGVRSEYTDGRDMPRLLIQSIEFEGPLYESWPPTSHTSLFIKSPNEDDPSTYAREIITHFASRAFRRPVTREEADSIYLTWKATYAESGDFVQAIKDALLVTLTSPQFMFLIETSDSPKAEKLGEFELASKISYFLWNTSPDVELLDLAASKQLERSLDAQVDRMIADARFEDFATEFATQWLSLEKVDVVEVDHKKYPALHYHAKAHLRQEPIATVKYLIENNMPLSQLIQSDFIVANDVVADYYGLAEKSDSGLRFAPIHHDQKHLGGVLSQTAILAGLSNGSESNPIKRGAWLARKIIAEPPEDPPPNVPDLEAETAALPLRARLELHRNQPGCAKCHAGIDPWGMPFEVFDAGGYLKQEPKLDASSTLPDGTSVQDLDALKDYLAHDRIDRVAFSFLKHLASYAVGRSLSYNELVLLEEKGVELRKEGYRMKDMVRWVIKSDLFMEK